MNSTMLRSFAHVSIASAMLAIALPSIGSAQAPRPAWVRFASAVVKPEMTQEYEGYLKQLSAAYKKSGLPLFAVYSTFAGNRNEYTSVTFVMKFGDMDGPPPIRKTLGDEAYNNLTRALTRCQVSSTWYYALPWDDVWINKPGPMGEYFIRSRIPIADGKFTAYREYLKNDLKPVLEKGGTTWFRAARPVFGAPAGIVETTRMLKNLGEIDGGPITTRVLGAAGAQALDAKAASLTRGPAQLTILRSRPELSWISDAVTAK